MYINVNTTQHIFNPNKLLSFRRKVTTSMYATLIGFTVVFMMKNLVKTYRLRRTTVKGHVCFFSDVKSIQPSQPTVVTYLKSR